MLLCEVALGDVKEVGVQRETENEEEEEDDNDKPLDLKKFQSRKGVGRRIPDPKHTITLNSGSFLSIKKKHIFSFMLFFFFQVYKYHSVN
jgi:hypothetical protein